MANQGLINSKVDLLSTKAIDLHGRQIKNAADSTNAGDYVTRRELEKNYASSSDLSSQIESVSSKIVKPAKQIFCYSLHFFGQLPNTPTPDVAPRDFIASDSNIIYIRADLKAAPVSSAMNVDLYELNGDLTGSTLITTFNFTSGVRFIVLTPAQIAALPALGQNKFFWVDMSYLSGTNCGSNLTITIRAQ